MKRAASLNDKYVSLSIDDWSNVMNGPVSGILLDTHLVDTLHTTDMQSYWRYVCLFEMSYCASSCPHIGEYMAKVIEDAMLKVKSKVKAHIVGIVTHNASNLERKRSRIQV